MNVWLELVLAGLAVYRLTRLVVKDEFPPIRWVRDRLAPDDAASRSASGLRGADPVGWHWVPEWLSDLVSCQWCASGWLALGVTVGLDAVTSVPLPVLWWFAVWAIGAVLVNYEDRTPRDPVVNFDAAAWQRAVDDRDEVIRTQHGRVVDLENQLRVATTRLDDAYASPYQVTDRVRRGATTHPPAFTGQQSVASATQPPRPTQPPETPPVSSGRHRADDTSTREVSVRTDGS